MDRLYSPRYSCQSLRNRLQSPTLAGFPFLLLRENYGLEYSEQRAKDVILGDMKTEIHTLATLNDEFIGCIHKQLDDRHMLYDGETASDGCIPQQKIDGVLKVTVLVFNVIKDNTRYSLTVSGE